MNALNSVLIEGNLTKNPEFTDTPRGYKVCNFSIATNRFYEDADKKPEKETSFLNIEAWGSQTDICDKLKKGSGVRIVGRLKQDRWVKDNNPMSRVKIIAEFVELKPSKAETHKKALSG